MALVSDRRMRALNRMFRGKDYATDVLSFPAGSEEKGAARRAPQGALERRPGSGKRGGADATPLGDIVVATGVAARQAKEHGHAPGVEFKVLALHGLLHLLGYDHEIDAGRMARAEARLRKKGGLPTGLIARAKRSSDSRLPTPGSRRRP